MKSSRYLIRLSWLLVLGALLVGASASIAGAGDRIVDDYFRDPTPIVTPPGERIVDDYFRDATRVTVPQPSGSTFDWGDWGIGLVAGFGLALGLAGAALLAVRRLPSLGKTDAASAR